MPAAEEVRPRQLWLLQRKPNKVGEGLAKTTGWIRRTLLARRGVNMLAGSVRKIRRRRTAPDHRRRTATARGRHRSSSAPGRIRCAISRAAARRGMPVFRIGGADVAAELDAKRAIDQGTRVAAAL